MYMYVLLVNSLSSRVLIVVIITLTELYMICQIIFAFKIVSHICGTKKLTLLTEERNGDEILSGQVQLGPILKYD